ncbi:MAG TPA: isochorismatase family protein [Polyangia bacterium]|jgi:isochorismate hydrolase
MSGIGFVTTENRGPDLTLNRDRAALLVIDWQERLVPAMDPQVHEAKLRNAVILCQAAGRLGLPIVQSEQYTKGLGVTVAPLRDALAPLGDAVRRFEKNTFSCAPAPELQAALKSTMRTQWIVCGMEAHVCVFQTVRDLCARGLTVHVAQDAILSRRTDCFKTALGLMTTAGAVITNTETILFDLLGCAGTEEFKAISKLVK